MAEATTEEPKKAPEAQVDIKRFTPEQREALEGSFEILELTGKTFEEIVKAYPEIRFMRTFERYGEGTGGDALMDALESMKSKMTEVAIPRYGSATFLPNSGVSQEEQKRMIKESSEDLVKKIPGVKRIMGDPLDYVELAAQYAEKYNGASLFGRWGNRKEAATPSGLSVGSMPEERSNPPEVRISHMRGGPNNEGPWAAPLIVPE